MSPQAADNLPQLRLTELRPYVSLLLAQGPADDMGETLFNRILYGCSEVSKLDGDWKRRGPGAEPKQEVHGGIRAGGLLIEEESRPAWTFQGDVWDRRYHLIAVVSLGNLFAFHSSDPGIRNAIANNIATKGVPGLERLSFIPPGIMNAAFVQGVTRTVWLRGIHRQTSLKSDTKTLSGVDLEDAIDPLGDGSYHFTAVRCLFDDGEDQFTLGVSPSQSRIWIGRSANWESFKNTAVTVLTHVSETDRPSYAPIPYLAAPGDGGVAVSHAFDMALWAPEWIGGGDGDYIQEETERITGHISFEITPQDGPNFTAIVLRDGIRIGTIALRFAIDGEHVVCNANAVPDRLTDQSDLQILERYCESDDMLLIRYDSTHVISGKLLFRYRFRDHAFGGYEWADMSDWHITKEKPSTLSKIGDEASLFCWVWWKWSGMLNDGSGGGWLLCDDGPGEKADFIHIDERKHELTFIHVKGSGSASPQRSVAVGSYEVVVSQAIKNLRYLDKENLQAGLLSRMNLGGHALTWYAGQPRQREEFVEAVSKLGVRCDRRVVIVQPHLQKAVWTQADADPESQEGGRLRQLNTLLVSAQTSCQSLNATLTVIGAS